MHVTIFLHVDLMRKINFMLGLDVDVLGAGPVGKNTAHLTMMQPLDNVTTMQKIITTVFAVVQNKDSKKKTTVLEVILDIVGNGGKQSFLLVECHLL